MLALTVASATLFAQVVGVSASAAEPFERNIDDGPYIVEISELEDTEVEKDLVEDSDKEKAGKPQNPLMKKKQTNLQSLLMKRKRETAEPSDEEKQTNLQSLLMKRKREKPKNPLMKKKRKKPKNPLMKRKRKKPKNPLTKKKQTNLQSLLMKRLWKILWMIRVKHL